MSEKIELNLTTAQLRKMRSGKPFQLSHVQLMEGTTSSRHEVEIAVSAHTAKKIRSALKRGKGFRFTPALIEGGSLKSFMKKASNVVQKGAQFVASNAGKIVEASKSMVNKDQLKNKLDEIATGVSLYNPELAPFAAGASKIAQRGVDAIYARDFTKGKSGVRGLRNAVQSEASTQGKVFGTQIAQKALAPMGRNVSTQTPDNVAPLDGTLRRRGRPRKVNIDNVLPSGPVDAVVEGDGFKNSGRGRFAKGSQAAKDFMNRLRSMRGGKKPINGGSFLALGGVDNSRSLANMNTNGGSFRALGR
jgi:hypothetical protein